MDRAYIQRQAGEAAEEQKKRGELIRAGWTTYLAENCEAGLSLREIKLMSTAFYAGGIHVFTEVMPSIGGDISDDEQVIEASLKRIDQIHAEIQRFLAAAVASLPVEGHG